MSSRCSPSQCLPDRSSLPTVLSATLLALCLPTASASGDLPQLAWTEDFATDPVVNNRFSIEPAEAVNRFTYDADQAILTTHYDTYQPTAWYLRPIDPSGTRQLHRHDDFEFSVDFRIRGDTFSPTGFGQISWGLINSQRTRSDRAGCSNPPQQYAFDCVTFDFFPCDAYPSLSPTIINSADLLGDMNYDGLVDGRDIEPFMLALLSGEPPESAIARGDFDKDGLLDLNDFPPFLSELTVPNDAQAFYGSMEWSPGAETLIEAGEDWIIPEQQYTLHVVYDGLARVATLTVIGNDGPLMINIQGTGGYGGFDDDPTTIQNPASSERGFEVDAFVLAAWQDTCISGQIVADIEFLRIEFSAPAVLLGDLDHDGLVNGRDIGPFLQALLSADPSPGAVARGDFSGNDALDLGDVQPFINRLTQP